MKRFTRYFESSSTPDLEDSVKNAQFKRKPKGKEFVPRKKDKGVHKKKNAFKRPDELKLSKAKMQRLEGEKQRERVPVNKERLLYHRRGEGVEGRGIRTNFNQKKLMAREKKIEYAFEQAARAELLLQEDSGYLEAEEGESTTQFTQTQIAASVDITSATKHFDLNLEQFGPYRMNYTRNGRFLLLGGRRGHVAAMDWVTKNLMCEINVMESVHDVRWLHIETMFAVAQKEWVHIYDNQGIELHCLKKLNRVTRMEFLPYHFLLVTVNEDGYLSWVDVSIGKMISRFNSLMGRPSAMVQNPYNAILCMGHAKGTVTMWSPNMRSPVAKILCHQHAVQSLAVDPNGVYMATSSIDRSVKIWDVRNFECLQDYKLRSAVSNLAFSQKGLLATGMENVVEVYKDCCKQTVEKPYLRHRMHKFVRQLEFCPFEDVLGVSSDQGFTSLLIPGAGEPNFDALEINPFQTKTQRREAEVKALLDKIQPELITLEPDKIAEVDVPTLKDMIEAKKKLAYVKVPKIDFEPRNKKGKRGGSAKAAKIKKVVVEQRRKDFVKSIAQEAEALEEILGETGEEEGQEKSDKPKSVLDRFLPETKHKKPVHRH